MPTAPDTLGATACAKEPHLPTPSLDLGTWATANESPPAWLLESSSPPTVLNRVLWTRAYEPQTVSSQSSGGWMSSRPDIQWGPFLFTDGHLLTVSTCGGRAVPGKGFSSFFFKDTNASRGLRLRDLSTNPHLLRLSPWGPDFTLQIWRQTDI